MENDTSNPYATPRTHANEGKDIIYVDVDGYTFGSALVANEDFKPPLICAKLGIPLEKGTNQQPIPITIFKRSIFPPAVSWLYNILLLLAIAYCLTTWSFSLIDLAKVSIIIGLSRLFKKPYQIPFHLSEQYLTARRNKSQLYLIGFAFLGLGLVYGNFSQNYLILYCSALVLSLVCSIFYFSRSHFTLYKKAGDFYFIHDIHHKLLASLPKLEVADKGKSLSEIYKSRESRR